MCQPLSSPHRRAEKRAYLDERLEELVRRSPPAVRLLSPTEAGTCH
jgi:hypothetical protein